MGQSTQATCSEQALTQRQAFRLLMPELAALRAKGLSFEEITEVLQQVCKFELRQATVKSYFYRLLKDEDVQASISAARREMTA